VHCGHGQRRTGRVGRRAEVYRFVVGPIENNVYVVRCKRTGEATLIDAANEHDRLLRVARRLGVTSVLETHGHWDHIGAVEQVREAGIDVWVRTKTPACCRVTTTCSMTTRSIRWVTYACARCTHPVTRPAVSVLRSKRAPCSSPATRSFRRSRQHQSRRPGLRDHHHLDRRTHLRRLWRRRDDLARPRRRVHHRHRASPPR